MSNIPLKTITFPGLDDTYTIPQVDNTLLTAGAAADAKKTGDEITDLKEAISELEPGLSDDAKTALLNCFQHVAWIDEHGQDYYNALEAELYPVEKTLVSISAVFDSENAVIYTTDSLDTLKQYLTVTALYDDTSTAVISNYILSGTLTVGTSIITVTYGEKVTTFTVEVYTKRTLLSSDVDSTIGFTNLTLTDGTFDYSASESFSLAVLKDSITKVKYIFLNGLTNDPRGAASIIFRKSGTTYYGIDNYGGVYSFVRSGQKYNAAAASGIATVNIENLNTFVNNTNVVCSLENNVLMLQNENGGKITISNANMIGWWTDSYTEWHIRWGNVEVISQ